MSRLRVISLWSCTAMLLITLTGCTSYSTYESVIINISDSVTGNPVANAEVSSQPMFFYIPAYPFDTVGAGSGKSSFGVTDESGKATLEFVDGPNRVLIIADGYATMRAVVEPEDKHNAETMIWFIHLSQATRELGMQSMVMTIPSQEEYTTD